MLKPNEQIRELFFLKNFKARADILYDIADWWLAQRDLDRAELVKAVEGILEGGDNCERCRDVLHLLHAVQRPDQEKGAVEPLGKSTQDWCCKNQKKSCQGDSSLSH